MSQRTKSTVNILLKSFSMDIHLKTTEFIIREKDLINSGMSYLSIEFIKNALVNIRERYLNGELDSFLQEKRIPSERICFSIYVDDEDTANIIEEECTSLSLKHKSRKVSFISKVFSGFLYSPSENILTAEFSDRFLRSDDIHEGFLKKGEYIPATNIFKISEKHLEDEFLKSLQNNID